MKKVFSFSLFGSHEKYWRGLYKNIDKIHEFFPDWHTYVWIGDNVSEDVVLTLSEKRNVILLPSNETGLINMSSRFFAIDDPEVEIMCVRDADSRITERDRACIEEFVNSGKLFHIIRDHPNHHHVIMGGMWGIKKGYLNGKLYDAFQHWRQRNTATEFWNDMDFLRSFFYPHVLPYAMIHDEIQGLEPYEWHTPFRIPLDDAKQHFIGQVYEFDPDGKEYPKFPYEKG
jgi:hypothetical protein